MWSVKYQKEILPNIEMVNRIIHNLTYIFDSSEIYHHYHSRETEMFEFTYQITNKKSEKWEIKFLGRVICNGIGLDSEPRYEDSYDEDDDYLFLIEDNEEKIYNICYKNTIDFIEQFLCIVKTSYAYEDGDIKYCSIEKKEGWKE